METNKKISQQLYVDRKNVENEKISALTEKQHDALQRLCAARHIMHSNIRTLILSSEFNNEYERPLFEAIKGLSKVKLPAFKSKYDMGDYIDIDSFDILDEIGEAYDKEEEYDKIYDKWEDLNNEIETYLIKIDKKYGTSYCPTGLSRI